MDSVLFHLKDLCSVHNSLRETKNTFPIKVKFVKTNSVNVNKSDQNSIHHYRCIIFPSPPILPSFQTELSISCCWSVCKFLNFLAAQWDQNYFEVQLSWNYYYCVLNLCFDDKIKNLWTKFSASKLQELSKCLSKSQLSP